MLTCYGHTCRLPRGTLTYLAFRLSVLDALDEIQSYIDLEEDLDNVDGVLTYVPILRQVPAPVQIDLLAEVWSRQRPPKPIEANLLDAAIVYAICCNASRIIQDEPEIAALYLDGGPRSGTLRTSARSCFQLVGSTSRYAKAGPGTDTRRKSRSCTH